MSLSCPKNDQYWLELHKWFVSNAKDKEADVLFIGGDHIALLGQSQFYLESLAPLHCFCFGSFNDTAANLLWRIENLEVENFSPKVVVVSIGQSDLETPVDEFLKILKCIAKRLKDKQPNADLFFLQLIPCGRKENKHRKFVVEINSQMESTLKGLANVIYVDSSLIDQNGEIDAHHLFDFFHLSQAGYSKVFEPVLASINAVFNP